MIPHIVLLLLYIYTLEFLAFLYLLIRGISCDSTINSEDNPVTLQNGNWTSSSHQTSKGQDPATATTRAGDQKIKQ